MPPLGDDPACALRDMLEEQRQSMIDHDPGARLGTDPENLHQHRVAARRSAVRARHPCVYGGGWQRALVELLRELGRARARP